MSLCHRPITIDDANAFVGVEHRHAGPVVWAKFALGAYDGDALVGVVIVGRTTARGLHDQLRAEVTRLATNGAPNACSFLYAAAKRVVQAMGYTSLKTYTRSDESGASLRAIGAAHERDLPARSWAQCSKKRARVDKSAPAPRQRWELLRDVAPTRPALRYHGGKWRLAPWIIEHFPPHRVYVEPFGGGASVLIRKPRVYAEVYNDLDREIASLFRVMRDHGDELCRAIELTPYARAEFDQSFLSSEDPIEQARRTIVRSFMGFGGNLTRPNRDQTPQRTGFRRYSSTNRRSTPAGDWTNWPDAMVAIVERLRGVFIENRDSALSIREHDSADTLHYIDPPYVHSTRGFTCVGNKGGGSHRGYRFELTDDQHAELAAVLHVVRGMVVVSGYPCELYDRDLYREWHRVERGHVADGARKRTEVLWLNAAAAGALEQSRAQISLLELDA